MKCAEQVDSFITSAEDEDWELRGNLSGEYASDRPFDYHPGRNISACFIGDVKILCQLHLTYITFALHLIDNNQPGSMKGNAGRS